MDSGPLVHARIPEVVSHDLYHARRLKLPPIGVRTIGPQAATTLAVLDALLDHGADIEANGACIGGGTPLADAVAFGQWKAARRLIERGALANL